MKKLIPVLLFLYCFQPVSACTIFILTDGNKVLFFNNEDYTNPNNRIWFIPAGKDFYGCAFVGYDDGSAQGGLNTAGLAFDWYAGGEVAYEPAAHMVPVRDNSSERMLEQCATVEEAIAFYKRVAEPGFAKATIIIADSTGASVIIGARNGALFFDKSTGSNVLGGQGKAVFQRLYNENLPVNLENGSRILQQCVATGPGGTLYSNSYNLKTGDIHFYDFSKPDKFTTLNIYDELEKGGHFYDIAQIEFESSQPLKPLLLNMQRLILYEFNPLENQEPEISSLVEKIFINGAEGKLNAGYFTEEFWKKLDSAGKDLQSEFRSLGRLKEHHLIQKEIADETLLYSYVMIFEHARLLQQFTLDKTGRVAGLKTLSAVMLNPNPDSEDPKKGRSSEPSRVKVYLLPIAGVLLIGFIAFILFRRRTSV